MMKKKSIYIYLPVYVFALFWWTSSIKCDAQSVETGFVKEYNGEKAKSPLAGVELNVSGAPSTISDSQGKYELKFAVLKPGEAIKCNDIYKDGYVIFNKDALDYWRISYSMKPFVIVMCKESAFRELKKKFYGIFEKSYKDEYEKQKAIAQQTATNKANLETQIKKLKKEYDEKIGNINTYVELFARIDRSEMDSIVGRALNLIEGGKIDEGIKVYEELKLAQLVDNQLEKWHSGENMLHAAEEMIQDSQRDLIILTEKLQQQIGLYEMGGADYREKRVDMMQRLVNVYRQLNSAFAGKYNEELGSWICALTAHTKLWKERIPYYREAAQLPSWHGAVALGSIYEFAALSNNQLVDSVRVNYTQALEMNMPDSMKIDIKKKLSGVGDFYELADNGDTLYFKIVSKHSVHLSSRTNMCSNKVSGNLTIPEYVERNGEKYHVTGISKRAFYRNRHLKSVKLPNSISFVESLAFDECDSLDTIVMGSRTKIISSYAIPLNTIIKLPPKIEDSYWINNFISNRINDIINRGGHRRNQSFKATYALLTDLCNHKSTDKQLKALCHGYMGVINIQCGDTLKALENYITASKTIAISNLYVAGIYDIQGNYDLAYRYYKKCIEANVTEAYNGLAYMYAKGKYVEQDFQKAMQLIDKAIVLSPQNAHYLDSKGEFFLMMGQRDSAMVYWNKVIELNPQFDKDNSDLYKQLFSQGIKDADKSNSTDISNEYLQDYINLIQLVAKYEYSLMPDAFYGCDYEELVSIGILAARVLINNKTKEQLDRYNAAYIATALRWAIRNELKIRYEWYSLGASKNSELFREDKHTEKEDEKSVDYLQKSMLRIATYSTAMMIYLQLKKEIGLNEMEMFSPYINYNLNDFTKSELEIINIGNTIVSYIQGIPHRDKELLISLFSGKSIMQYNTSLDECNQLLNQLSNVLRQSTRIKI